MVNHEECMTGFDLQELNVMYDNDNNNYVKSFVAMVMHYLLRKDLWKQQGTTFVEATKSSHWWL